MLVVAIFLLGMNYDSLFSRSLAKDSIVIEQEWHNWSAGVETSKPLLITIFARNNTDKDLNGEANFKVHLDPVGFEKDYIDEIIKQFGEELLLKDSGDGSKLKAIAAYIKRGKKLPDGKKYEPIENQEDGGYVTSVSENVMFKAGETKKMKIEVVIPPRYKGYILTITQE